MSIVEMSIRSLTLPKDKSLISVDYQVSNDGTFSGNDLVIDIKKDTVNKTGREFELDFNVYDIYYGRIKLNFNSAGTDYYLGKPVVLTRDGNGFSHNNSIIVTPKISITSDIHNCETGGFSIDTSDFVIFTGIGNHHHSNWFIKSSNGDIVWKREKDKNNLTSIRIPTETLDLNKHYIIEVVHVSDGNQMSNRGKLLIKTTGTSVNTTVIKAGDKRPTSEEFKDLQLAYNDLLTMIVNDLALGGSV